MKYSRFLNKFTPTLINFLTFFQGLRFYSGLHRAHFSSISIRYKRGYAYSFCQIFQGLRLFQTLEYKVEISAAISFRQTVVHKLTLVRSLDVFGGIPLLDFTSLARSSMVTVGFISAKKPIQITPDRDLP